MQKSCTSAVNAKQRSAGASADVTESSPTDFHVVTREVSIIARSSRTGRNDDDRFPNGSRISAR